MQKISTKNNYKNPHTKTKHDNKKFWQKVMAKTENVTILKKERWENFCGWSLSINRTLVANLYPLRECELRQKKTARYKKNGREMSWEWEGNDISVETNKGKNV